MKKLLMILLSLNAYVFAQTIPNGAFENWTNLNFDNPDNWFSANLDKTKESGVVTISKVTGSSGFAIRLETKSYQSKIAEAWISTTNGDPRTGEGGYSYSQKPSTLIGKYRCSIVTGDTAFIVAIFKKNGIIMGSATGKFTGSANTFTSFSFPVLIGATPDSVIIAASSSNLIEGVGVSSGSWLELDELAFGGTGITQPILNGNFENWTSQSSAILQDWSVFGDFGVSRISDPFKGNYAIKMTTFIDPIDGVRQCGIGLSQEVNGQTVKSGVKYNLQQDTLFGYYKLSAVGGDHSYIFARTFKNGVETGWYGKELYGTSSYQYFEIVINSPIQPDTLDVRVESSAQSTMQSGTTLIMDEIQLKSSKLNTTGMKTINQFRKSKFSIFPNPATDDFMVGRNVDENFIVKVLNMEGKEVLNKIVYAEKYTQVEISQLNPGLYVVSITDQNGFTQFTRLIKN